MEEKNKEIVLTGGPCAGKTTGLSYVSEKLSDYGFRVFTPPEIATIFISRGIKDIKSIAAEDFQKYVQIEEQMILCQNEWRRRFNQLAKIFKDEKCVIIYDRAEMDAMAYVGEEYFTAILERNRIKFSDIMDTYKTIIHLVTAANGAEEFYSNENNPSRYENLEEARIADEKTRKAWEGHPHLKIIDNTTDFEGKMRRLLKTIAKALDIPVPLEIERKFLVSSFDCANKYFKEAQNIWIEQMYLQSDTSEELRIRKRMHRGAPTYYKTYKLRTGTAKTPEREAIIDPIDYLDLQRFRDPSKLVIKKNRYCFTYNYQYFELDLFQNPPGKIYLEIELTEENERFELPPFIKIKKEVTGDPKHTNYGIASIMMK